MANFAYEYQDNKIRVLQWRAAFNMISFHSVTYLHVRHAPELGTPIMMPLCVTCVTTRFRRTVVRNTFSVSHWTSSPALKRPHATRVGSWWQACATGLRHGSARPSINHFVAWVWRDHQVHCRTRGQGKVTHREQGYVRGSRAGGQRTRRCERRSCRSTRGSASSGQNRWHR